MEKFHYSLIKYLPNPKRGEIINIGLIVYRDEGIDVRLLKNASKLRLFDNQTSAVDIEKYETSLIKVTKDIDSAEDQYSLVKSFKSSIYVSDRGFFSIESLSDYENKIESLFASLVKPYSVRESGPRSSRLFTQIKHRFTEMNLLASDPSEINSHKIVMGYALGENTGMTADFLIKNGKYHMTGVIDFNLNDPATKYKETTLKVMSFVQGRKILGSNLGCYLVYSATSERERDISHHLNLAEDYSSKMFNLESASEKAAYFQLQANLAGHELPLH